MLKILKHVDNFCKERNIRYFLAGGTLLGAIRHKGFIPWDDDIDIMMFRDDYERFVKEYVLNDKSHFKLFTNDLNKNFHYTYAKIGDTSTHLIDERLDAIDVGVNIDLFPIDNVPNSKFANYKLVRSNLFLQQIMTMKQLPLKEGRGIMKNAVLAFAHFLLKPVSINAIINKITANSIECKDDNSELCGLTVAVRIDKQIHPRKDCNEVKMVDFEGLKLPAPSGYDDYLRHLYGDYMTLPSPEKRIAHHNFQAYID